MRKKQQDTQSETMSATIKKQVEFYFSDSNFRKDTFLKAAAAEDKDGFVPISVLLTFNKLKNLTTDVAKVAEALKDSEVVVVSEDGESVRRSTPLDENDTSKQRTLYVKGFPLDDNEVTIEAIETQFSEYGKVLMVRLRKDFETKAFRGSAFVEYESADSVKKACEAANGAEGEPLKIAYKGTPFVCVMPLESWLERKAAKRARNKKGGKKTGDDLEKAAEASVGSKRKADEVEEAPKVEYTSGLIIKINKVPSEATLFQIKDLFKSLGDVKYVEFTAGNSEAYVRTADLASSTKIMSAIENGLKVPDCEGENLTGVVVTGDDEHAYWVKLTSDAKKKNGRGNNGGRGNKRRKFGGRR